MAAVGGFDHIVITQSGAHAGGDGFLTDVGVGEAGDLAGEEVVLDALLSNEKTAFAPAKTKRACEVIYDQIYNKIVQGELEPGDRLPPERVLAEQFQRSRPSVREALRMLQQNGLIRIDIGSAGGSIVQGFSVSGLEKNLKDMIDSGVFSLQELKDYRIVNDMGCARLAAQNRTAEDIAALEKNIVRYGASVADIEALHVIDEEFHAILAAASHNAMVVTVNSAITEIIVAYFWNRAREFSSQKILHINQMAYEAHAALARAVISGDLEDAEKQMQRVNRAFHEATQ